MRKLICPNCQGVLEGAAAEDRVCQCFQKNPVVYGWVCPVCGRGNGPYTNTCPCKPFEIRITCQPSNTSFT